MTFNFANVGLHMLLLAAKTSIGVSPAHVHITRYARIKPRPGVCVRIVPSIDFRYDPVSNIMDNLVGDTGLCYQYDSS